MDQNLQKLEKEIEEINQKLMDPDVLKDISAYKKMNQRLAEINPIVDIYRNIQDADQRISDAEELLSDPEMKDLAKEELDTAKADKERLEADLTVALIPKDPNDDKDIIVEIRAGAGGDEAALFGGELGRAYMRFAESIGFKTALMSKHDAESGGIKEMVFEIKGLGAYSKLKYETLGK